jgi:Kdo2-lipid A phosphotransferase
MNGSGDPKLFSNHKLGQGELPAARPTVGSRQIGFSTACVVAAAALLASWWWPPTRSLWDTFDETMFHVLNGVVLNGSDSVRVFWAATNTRIFDALSALGFGVIFATWMWAGGWSRLSQRASEGLFIAVATVVVLDVSSNMIFTFERLSPSLVLEPIFRLSEVVSFAKVKDQSGNSFPGDHGTAVVLFTVYIWAFAGVIRGIIALALASFVVLPRMIGGAHWVTDLLVGSAAIGLVAVALTLALPTARLFVWAVAPGLQRMFNALARLGILPKAIIQDAVERR